MKKLFLLLLMIPLLLVNCKKDDDNPTPTPEPTDSYGILATYLVDNDMDLPDILAEWIVAAPADEAALPAFLDMYDIIDIRSAAHFAEGHIEGAINSPSPLTNILDVAENTTKPILVVCYSGQTAGHAVVGLRLSGYADAKVLKFGMSGWNSNNSAPWEGNSGPENGVTAIGHPNWVTTATTTPVEFNNPTLTGSVAEAILEERVELMLTGGLAGITNVDVLDAPEDTYFINNYWDQTDVDHYGHIAEAYRVKPLSIENGEMKNMDPSKTLVTYCWTGQTSSMVTAYLNVIGYNAKSLRYGANGMIYTELEAHKFVTPTVDLPVVTE